MKKYVVCKNEKENTFSVINTETGKVVEETSFEAVAWVKVGELNKE